MNTETEIFNWKGRKMEQRKWSSLDWRILEDVEDLEDSGGFWRTWRTETETEILNWNRGKKGKKAFKGAAWN